MSGEEGVPKDPGPTAPGAPSTFDFDALQRRLGDDREGALAVLSAFAREAPKQLARLGQAVEAGNTDQVRLAAHTLKGSLLWIGAAAAAASAQALELNSTLESAVEPHTSLSRLTSEVNQILSELKSSSLVILD